MKGVRSLKLEKGRVRQLGNPRGKQGPENGVWAGLQTKQPEANIRNL